LALLQTVMAQSGHLPVAIVAPWPNWVNDGFVRQTTLAAPGFVTSAISARHGTARSGPDPIGALAVMLWSLHAIEPNTVAECEGHASSSDVDPGFAVAPACETGWETGTFRLKCTPSMRMAKQSAAAVTAMAPRTTDGNGPKWAAKAMGAVNR